MDWWVLWSSMVEVKGEAAMGGGDGRRRREVAGWCGLRQMMNERIDFLHELLNSVSEIKLVNGELSKSILQLIRSSCGSRGFRH